MESDRLFYQGKEYFDGARLTKADDPTIVSHLIYQRNQFDEAVNQKVVREDHLEGLNDAWNSTA